MSIQRNYAWLEITEYLSIVASMIGSIAAVAVNQAIFMAVPMSISLMLNLLHRQNLLNSSKKRIELEVTEECQEVSNMAISLNTSELQNLPTQKQLKEEIAALPALTQNRRIRDKSLINCAGKNLPTLPIESVSKSCLPLEEMESSLVRLCQKVESQQLEMNRLMNYLDKFRQEIRQSLKNIPREIQDFQENSERIQPAQTSSVEGEISSIKIELARISEELARVDRNTESLVPKKNFKQIISTIKILCQETLISRESITQLHQAVANLSQNYPPKINLLKEDVTDSALTGLTSSSNPFQEKFDNCLQQISDLRESLAELTGAIDLLERRSEQIVPRSELRGLISEAIETQWDSMRKQATMSQSSSFDGFYPNSGQGNGEFNGGDNRFSKSFDVYGIPQLHREIENLSEEIATLEAQMENRLSPLEAIDRHGIAEDLSLQAQAIAELQQQTNKLLAFYEGAREVGE